jgi:hypothetical protein
LKCHYCGKEVWLVRHLLDGDFCSPAHRKKYNERLRRALDQLPGQEGPPAPIAGFQFLMPPAGSQLQDKQRSRGFQSTLAWPCLPTLGIGLSPLFGQTFFGPHVASAAGAEARSWLSPLLPPATTALFLGRLDLGQLGAGWTERLRTSLAAGMTACRDVLPLPTVNIAAGRTLEPLTATAAPQQARTSRIACPLMATATVLADGLVDERPAVLRRPVVPLRTFVPATMAAVRASAGRPGGAAEPLPHPLRIATDGFVPLRAAAAQRGAWISLPFGAFAPQTGPSRQAEALVFSRRPAGGGSAGLAAVRCVLPTAGSPLLAEDCVQRGLTSCAVEEAVPLSTAMTARLPEVASADRPRPARENEAIWKIAPAAPWLISQRAPETCPMPLAETSLPRLAVEPMSPSLASDFEVRSIAAPRAETAPAIAATQQVEATQAILPVAPPEIPAAGKTALPEANAPYPTGAEVVSPVEGQAAPARETGAPVPGLRARAGMLGSALQPCLDSCEPAAPSHLHAAGPMPAEMPVFIPQAAAPRTSGTLVSSASRTSATALPGEGVSGFARGGFALIHPATAQIESRHITPVPATVPGTTLSRGRIEIAPRAARLESLAEAIPLDLYVRRVRSASRRECEWRPLRTQMVQPYAMPTLWPARFEQQVLQDWRRRHPARQAAVAPAPIFKGAKVLSIAQRRGTLGRLHKHASQFVKGMAAAAMIAAIAWLSWSARGVRSTITADRHWLRSAITERAALVLDDNFRSGLNLWEGRKNWARSWSYSTDGFVRTGQLALYRPTMNMQNYRLEFFAQIESKSVGWVVRAKDEQNYYAMKLSVTEPGPRPLVSVVRYPVTHGQKGKRVQIPLPIMMHNNTPYHVALDVKGNRFRTFIEDQEVDSFSDDHLRAGGVGFFSEGGEHARLYWVKVSNNTDWLGRLCGMIAGDKPAGEKSRDEADLWDPDDVQGRVAALDGTILDGAKNVDRRRGALREMTLPIAIVFLGGAL